MANVIRNVEWLQKPAVPVMVKVSNLFVEAESYAEIDWWHQRLARMQVDHGIIEHGAHYRRRFAILCQPRTFEPHSGASIK